MKDEIKEILEALKVDEEELELKSSVYPLELTPKEQKILLDYITNLQEENERLKKENQDFVVEQNALAYYLVKKGLSFEDIVKIINDFKNEQGKSDE